MKWIATLTCGLALATASPALAQQTAPQAMPVGLIAFQIGVTDFQKSIDFYALLGMKLGRKPHPNEWELVWQKPATGAAIMMLLYDATKPSKVAPGTGFMIVGVPDAQAVAAKLRGMGYPNVGDVRDSGDYSVLILSDPDGNRIEMIGPSKKPAPAKQ